MTDDPDTDPYDQRPVDIRTSLAATLADQQAILADLATVVDLCNRIDAEFAREQFDEVLVEALGSAALVAYARCFVQGRRARLGPKDVKALRGSSEEDHAEMMNIRNKHIAHSVNAHEQPATIALLGSKASGQRAVVGLMHVNLRLPALNGRTVALLRQLATGLQAALLPAAQAEHEAMFEALKQQDAEALYRLPRASWKTPGREASGATRSHKPPAGDGPWFRFRIRDLDAPPLDTP